MAGVPKLTREDAERCLDILLEQERALHFDRFDSTIALELGTALAGLAGEFDEAYVVRIVRAADGETCFQWLSDDKGTRNLGFAQGKIAETLTVGHATPWRQIMAHLGEGTLKEVFADAPLRIAGCGGFPVLVGDDVVAAIGVSGLHHGLDHELIVRALEGILGVSAPRFPMELA